MSEHSSEHIEQSQDNDAHGQADDDDVEDVFINNHDLIGVDGIIDAQKEQIAQKKVS